MDKIKRLITIVIPNKKCNLKCEYCYISQLDRWDEPAPVKYSPEHIAKCLSQERLGGKCLINFTAEGETLLQPDLPEIVEGVLKEGHYVEIVTNAVPTKQLQAFLALDKDLLTRLEFKISFHYKELMRLNILDKFFENVQMIRDAGASFTLELMAYDGIEDQVDNIKEICRERTGAVCHATIGRDESTTKRTLLTDHSKEEFEEIWAPLDSTMTEVKLELLDKKRKEFCYAGCWSLHINLCTGEAQPCYGLPWNQNVFEDPSKPIKFSPVGHMCPQPFCINGHAHATLGVIPELEMPTYEQIRNRECNDGSEWFTPQAKEFFSSKLVESNKPYSFPKRLMYNIRAPFLMVGWLIKDKSTWFRAKRFIKRYVLKKS